MGSEAKPAWTWTLDPPEAASNLPLEGALRSSLAEWLWWEKIPFFQEQVLEQDKGCETRTDQ